MTVVGYYGLPEFAARCGVEGNEVGVEGAEVKGVAVDGEPAIDTAAAGGDAGGEGVGVTPEDAASAGVESYYVVGGIGEVHDAIDYQRSGFDLVWRVRLPDPFEVELCDIGWGDFFEQAVVGA